MRAPTKEVWNGDYKCINIKCERDIPAHIVKKQFTHPRYRICSSCKIRESIIWKCIGCDNIIDINTKNMGSFYCSVVCVSHSRHARTYAKKIRPIILPSIRGCQYCTKKLTHTRKIPFCDVKCSIKHRALEKHRMTYKQDMIKRSNARMLVKNPNYGKEKRIKHKKAQQLYQKRRYNVKKLVANINNKETNI